MMTVNYNELNKKVDYFLEKKKEFYQPHTVVITIIYYCSSTPPLLSFWGIGMVMKTRIRPSICTCALVAYIWGIKAPA